MTFNIDRKQVSEGEYVTVSWECQTPDMVTLSVEDGGKTIYQLGDSGSRVIRASGNADKMVLTLRVATGGRTEEKTLTVKVKRKVLKAEKVNYAPRNGEKKKKFDLSRIKDGWSRFTAQSKTAWTYMPAEKKLAYKIMGLMVLVLALNSISPKLYTLGVILVVGYLSWIILRK